MRDQFVDDGIVLDNALAFWVHRVYQAQRNEMYRRFREHDVDLTPEQWAVLVRLWERDGQTQSELADTTFRDRPTMSRMIDAMAERGLVERRVDAVDSRTRRVHLTRSSKALEGVLVPVAQDLVGRMVRGIDEHDLQVTRATLRRIFGNLE